VIWERKGEGGGDLEHFQLETVRYAGPLVGREAGKHAHVLQGLLEALPPLYPGLQDDAAKGGPVHAPQQPIRLCLQDSRSYQQAENAIPATKDTWMGFGFQDEDTSVETC